MNNEDEPGIFLFFFSSIVIKFVKILYKTNTFSLYIYKVSNVHHKVESWVNNYPPATYTGNKSHIHLHS